MDKLYILVIKHHVNECERLSVFTFSHLPTERDYGILKKEYNYWEASLFRSDFVGHKYNEIEIS